MNYAIAVTAQPEGEPITLAEAKLHLRVDVTDDDALITALLTAAREWCETYCRRSFVDRTVELYLDCFPAEIRLPNAPVIAVDAIEYVDSGGSETVLASSQYQVDLKALPPRIVPPHGVVWPQTKIGQVNAVTVTYRAGYGTGGSPLDLSDVPAAAKAAMKILIGYWYQNRENGGKVPDAVRALLAPLVIFDFSLEQ